MKVAYLLPLVAFIGLASGSCLLKAKVAQTTKCIIEENPDTGEWLQELCKNVTSIADLSIVAEYKNQLESFRTLGDYCTNGAVGRLSWVRNTDIYELFLNSEKVDMVSFEGIFYTLPAAVDKIIGSLQWCSLNL